MTDRIHTRRRAGFSLVELIVAIALLSLLAGALAPAAIQQVEARRMKATRIDLRALAKGLVGNPELGDFGYVGDMGGTPPALEDLNTPAGKPPFVVGAAGVAVGYGGPYAPTVRPDATGVFVDAWGMPFQYAGAAQVASAGTDRISGNADDLIEPANPIPVQGNLVIRLLGVPNTGDPAGELTAADADVFVTRSNVGVAQEIAMVEPVSGPGPWTITGLHIGYHAIRAVGQGAWAGAGTVRDVASVRRGTALLTVVLAQP